ncbi:MAG: CpaF family protein [Anaerolineales bacterium]|jgi:pilus assembly protein CpaF
MATTDQMASIPVGALDQLRTWLKEQVARNFNGDNGGRPEYEKVQSLLEKAYEHARVNLPESLKRELLTQVMSEVLGFGVIQRLLDDPEITEIMINGPEQIYVERQGLLEKSSIKLTTDEILRLIDRIITPIGRRIDAEQPMVDARLPDGSRVNAVIPPVAIDGPGVTIRKFARERMDIHDLIRLGSLSEHVAGFLEACVVSRLNTIVSGGTGSGKTTLLNIISGYIPEGERIVTIEDAAELQLHQEHVFRLEAKPANADGNGEIGIRSLVRNALRMRPDRIIVGEVRGGEALDMLQAMNTGHDGSLTTLHANSPRDAASRLETLVLLAGFDLPLKVVREQIASAADLIVQQSRMRDGSRKVTSISEVVGMEGETIVMTELFRFEETGTGIGGKLEGQLVSTGMRPMFESRLNAAGFTLPAEWFANTTRSFNTSTQH